MNELDYRIAIEALENHVAQTRPIYETAKAIDYLKKALVEALAKQEQGEPVACDNCKKLTDELERLRIKAELWKRDSIVWKSAYDVEVGFREQEKGEQIIEIEFLDWVHPKLGVTHVEVEGGKPLILRAKLKEKNSG